MCGVIRRFSEAGAIRQKEGEQSGCFKGEGHCCHAKCDGSHEFGDQAAWIGRREVEVCSVLKKDPEDRWSTHSVSLYIQYIYIYKCTH